MGSAGVRFGLVATLILAASPLFAQSAPSPHEVEGYGPLQRAASDGDVGALSALLDAGADVEVRDGAGRTPAIIAAFGSHGAALERLAAAGADLDALEDRAYDVVTIAAVADDRALLDRALDLGAAADTVTSPYDGTALIAAAHLGHHEVVARLIEADAPLDHVNNLGWTALMEAVVLGDGGADHAATVRALVEAGADRSIADRDGTTPLEHARRRGHEEIVGILRRE